jgi:hypothetical protein
MLVLVSTIIFASIKHFDYVPTADRALGEHNSGLKRGVGGALNVIIFTIHGTSFCGLRI